MATDTLSRKGLSLTQVQVQVTCFDTLKDQYEDYAIFGKIG